MSNYGRNIAGKQPDGTQGIATVELTFQTENSDPTKQLVGCVIHLSKKDASFRNILKVNEGENKEVNYFIFVACFDRSCRPKENSPKIEVKLHRYKKEGKVKEFSVDEKESSKIFKKYENDDYFVIPCTKKNFKKSTFLKKWSSELLLHNNSSQVLQRSSSFHGFKREEVENKTLFKYCGFDKLKEFDKLEDGVLLIRESISARESYVIGCYKKENGSTAHERYCFLLKGLEKLKIPLPTQQHGTTPRTDGHGAPPSTDGHGTTPRTDGHGAPISTDGRGTTPSTDGHGTTPSTDGRGTTPSTDGRGTTPSTDGRGTTPSTDGRGTTPSTDGRGATPSTDGHGAPLSTDGHGAITTSHTDGQGAAPRTYGHGAIATPRTDGQGAAPRTYGHGAITTPHTDGQGAAPRTYGHGAITTPHTDGQGAATRTYGHGAIETPHADGQGAAPRTYGYDATETFKSFLYSFAEKVGKDWKHLGRVLGIPHVLDAIDIDYRYTKEKAVQMFSKWIERNGNEATPQKLVDVLKNKLDNKQLAEEVEEWMKTGKSS